MRRWSKCWIPSLVQLLHNFLLSVTHYSLFFSAQHIPGVHSQIADALSCFHWQEFDSWLQVLSQSQHQFLPSFCWNWSVFSRTAMSRFPYAWLSPIHLQDLCNRSKEVLQILSSARQASSLWVALSHWWIDSVFVCNFSGEIHTPFDYQGLYVWCLCASCWAGLTRSPTELSADWPLSVRGPIYILVQVAICSVQCRLC